MTKVRWPTLRAVLDSMSWHGRNSERDSLGILVGKFAGTREESRFPAEHPLPDPAFWIYSLPTAGGWNGSLKMP